MTDLDGGGAPTGHNEGSAGGDDGWDDSAWVPERRRRRWPLVLVALVALGIAAASLAGLWYTRQADPPGDPGEEVEVAVPLGSSPARIARLLEERGVIGDARAFRLYVKLKGVAGLQAGDYVLRRGESFDDVVAALRAGPKIEYERLTIPEGFRLDQVAGAVGGLTGRSAERFLELARSGQVRSTLSPDGSTNLEGLLLPDTYNIEAKDDEEAILRRLVASMEVAFEEAGGEAAAARLGLTPYEALIVASLIEREVRVPEERPKVAQVLYNRLEKKMRLQIDATVLYAIGHKERVLFKDLEVDSPYNTYKVAGLPPTPIAMPGRASIEAALNPEPGPWLYYVVIDPSGRQAFATTLAEHNRNIAQAERNGAR